MPQAAPDGEMDVAAKTLEPRERRRRVLKRALAILDEHANSIPCVVRDISETGAKLVFEEFSPVPVHFELHVELDGFKVECERIWYENGVCGVRFIGEKRMAGALRAQVVKETRFGMSMDAEATPERSSAAAASPGPPPASHGAARPSRTFGKRS